MSKKISALCAGLILTLSLCSCGTTEVEPIVTQENVVEDKKITFLTNFGLSQGSNSIPIWEEEFEKQTGYAMQLDSLSGDEYYQVLDYTLAMGRAHDVVAMAEGKLPSYVVDRQLLDITEMVQSSEILSKIPEEYMKAATVDGKVYGVPVEFGGGTITYVRQDILDELGINAPKNFDEFIAMLEKIKEAYPEMIPFTAPGLVGSNNDYYMVDFYHDASPEIIEVDGKWVDGMLQDNMRAALERLRLAYSKGLIDPNITTNGTKEARTKFMDGKAAVFNYWAGNWNSTLQNNLTKSLGEHALVGRMNPIKEVTYKIRPSVVLSITKNANNPEAVFEHILEYMHDDAEGSKLFQYGVEDIHYKIEGNEIVQQKGEYKISSALVTPVMAFERLEEYVFKQKPEVVASLELLKEYGEQQYNLPSSVTYITIEDELIELKTQTISDAMVGKLTIDEALENYKAKAEALGMSRVLEEMNA
ncbi:MAG: extracellular solute-binding protein [Cellulosilyticum sp.]|nr:extracellular solute-binding protein [Cellulosilyticum sp.]